jgi:hypothetical protein
VVYGANLSDMIVSGDDIFNKQPKSYIVTSSTYFSRVPDSVIHLFISQGGTINYTDDTLVGKKDINGIYIYESKRIILKVNEDNSTWDEVEKAPVHEIGHFIYQMTLPNFTEQMRVDLATLYSERKSFDPRCTNADETFAALYSDYIKYNYNAFHLLYFSRLLYL